MGRQVNFFMHPEDENVFLDFLKTTGDVAYIPLPQKSMHLQTSDKITPRNHPDCWLRVYLLLKTYSDDVIMEEVKSQRYWLIDEFSPVIQFRRCFFDGKILRRGRLYFVTSYYDEQGEKVSLPEPFLKWGARILSWIRKNYIKVTKDSYYTSPSALAFQKSGGILEEN